MGEVHGALSAVRGDVAGVQVLVAGLTAAIDALPTAVLAAVDSRLSQLTGPEQQLHMLENLAALRRGEGTVHPPASAGWQIRGSDDMRHLLIRRHAG